MQTKPQTLLAWPDFAAEEWLKKPLHCLWRNRLARVAHREIKLRAMGRGMDSHRLVWRAVREAVGEQI